jgi:glutathione synthase/RimK-type ligase-like ATP-grasp enzyme
VLAKLREEHGPWLVLQEFDRALLTTGETRVIALGAEVCGAISKTPHPRHLIMNLDAPDDERPRLAVAEPSPEQHRRATEIARALAAEGVYLATIDFIGDRVLEINVTSPGLIRWLDERLEPSRKIAHRYWKGLFKPDY